MSTKGVVPKGNAARASMRGMASAGSPRDVSESSLLSLDPELLALLLKDQTTGKNIRWGTDIYQRFGHSSQDEMTVEAITTINEGMIRPRVDKPLEEQRMRSKDKAEVFTPAWVCNAQNNLIDEAWFGRPNVFNTPAGDNNWHSTRHISFSKEKTWKDYVLAKRLEVSCGEGPYLTSRFDVVTGAPYPVPFRIGILDRKLRVVSENCKSRRDWIRWAEYAVKSTYGFDWQGDNILIAREHILYAVNDALGDRFKTELTPEEKKTFAGFISWNIWQMDGLKCVVPETCHDESRQDDFFDSGPQSKQTITTPCPGCKKNDVRLHNGIPCKIKDWACNKKSAFFGDTIILFRDLIK